jgi:serine protease Do
VKLRRLLVQLPPWAALALGAAGCRVRDEPVAEGAGSGAAPAPARTLYQEAPGSFVGLVERARHGVVAIRAPAPVKSGPAAMFPGAPAGAADVALGTGFLVDAGAVYVLTNDHIAKAAPELRVALPDGNEVSAKVLGQDERLRVALLAIDVPRLRALPLGDSDEVRVGDWIAVLGNPFGAEVSASAGIVSATGRGGSIVAGGPMGFRRFLQLDARVHRGNSGGPVIDAAGFVVGIAVATGERPEELSFAAPIKEVRQVLGQLRDHGAVARSWLGAFVQPVTAERAQELGLPRAAGALVTGIQPGSPAARSALREGDVILRWDDRPVDGRSLPWIIAQTPIGKSIEIVVWRSRAEHAVAVVTEKMPE